MFFPLMALADTNAPSQADFVSLKGEPVPAGNPIEGNADTRIIRSFKAPALWLFRSNVAAPLGTVLLCPGGGYNILEMRKEGENTARELNSLGFDVAILEYHIASGTEERDLALTDALAAFSLLKADGRALNLHTQRLEIMGYSAGGHLATRTAQKLGADEQPEGLILIYPAYLNETTPAVVVPHNHRRLFALIAANDKPDWVKGCESYVKAWKEAGGDATFHLLPDGGHGFGMATPSIDSTRNWPNLLKDFLLERPNKSPDLQ